MAACGQCNQPNGASIDADIDVQVVACRGPHTVGRKAAKAYFALKGKTVCQHLDGFTPLWLPFFFLIIACLHVCLHALACVHRKRNIGLFLSCLPQQELGVPFLMSARAALCSFIHGSHDDPAVQPAAPFSSLEGSEVPVSAELMFILVLAPCCCCCSLGFSRLELDPH